MSSGKFEVIAFASGEVRDKDGNLIEAVTGERVFTEDDLAAMGMSPEQIDEIKRTGGL
jgi:hypothetical protein